MDTHAEDYRGHSIELRSKSQRVESAETLEPVHEQELVIDGRPMGFRRLPGGSFFLNDYAYDWHDNLLDLARAYVDYLASYRDSIDPAPLDEETITENSIALAPPDKPATESEL